MTNSSQTNKISSMRDTTSIMKKPLDVEAARQIHQLICTRVHLMVNMTNPCTPQKRGEIDQKKIYNMD